MFVDFPPSHWQRFKEFGRNNVGEIALVTALLVGSAAVALDMANSGESGVPASACVFSNNYNAEAVHPVAVSGPFQYSEAARHISDLIDDCLPEAETIVMSLNTPPRANYGFLLIPDAQVFER